MHYLTTSNVASRTEKRQLRKSLLTTWVVGGIRYSPLRCSLFLFCHFDFVNSIRDTVDYDYSLWLLQQYSTMEITKETHYLFSKIEADLKLTIPCHVNIKNILWCVFKDNFGSICFFLTSNYIYPISVFMEWQM